jgi:cell division protein FtsB
MSDELKQVQQDNEKFEIRRRRLEAADPAIIEALARDRLQMLKPGEVLFINGTPTPQGADEPAATTPAPSSR